MQIRCTTAFKCLIENETNVHFNHVWRIKVFPTWSRCLWSFYSGHDLQPIFFCHKLKLSMFNVKHRALVRNVVLFKETFIICGEYQKEPNKILNFKGVYMYILCYLIFLLQQLDTVILNVFFCIKPINVLLTKSKQNILFSLCSPIWNH